MNGISIKTELKTEQTTAAEPVAPGRAADADTATAVDLLLQTGFDEETARHLARKRPLETIQRQLTWLSQRSPSRNRLGLLRRAIEHNWPKPAGASEEPETADGHLALAKVFASHYYAAYHGFDGPPATEPFPKDLALAGKFIARLLAQENNEGKTSEWGQRFGRLARENHRNDPKAQLSGDTGNAPRLFTVVDVRLRPDRAARTSMRKPSLQNEPSQRPLVALVDYFLAGAGSFWLDQNIAEADGVAWCGRGQERRGPDCRWLLSEVYGKS